MVRVDSEVGRPLSLPIGIDLKCGLGYTIGKTHEPSPVLPRRQCFVLPSDAHMFCVAINSR